MCFLNIDELVHLIAVKLVGKKEKKGISSESLNFFIIYFCLNIEQLIRYPFVQSYQFLLENKYLNLANNKTNVWLGSMFYRCMAPCDCYIVAKKFDFVP